MYVAMVGVCIWYIRMYVSVTQCVALVRYQS